MARNSFEVLEIMKKLQEDFDTNVYMCVNAYRYILTLIFLVGPETNKYMHGKVSICFPKVTSIKFYILGITHIIVIAPHCPLFWLVFSIHICIYILKTHFMEVSK